MSMKALLNYVLEEVAIDGAQGTTIQELFHYVNDFYVKNRQERCSASKLLWVDQSEGQSLEEDAAAIGNDKINELANIQPFKSPDFWGLPNVKEEFQEYVWELLRQEKDFNIGPKNEARNMTLKEIVDKLKNENQESEQLKVYAAEERRWRTLTGHGPNWKKVPNAVFKCLEVIGKHREKGLIQPELTRITGQDKKSIAGRTTLLKDMGYIEKMNVLARNMNTSKLTLTKFAARRDQQRAQITKYGERNKGTVVAGGTERWSGDTIHTESLVNAIIAELKVAKNGVVQRGDLKKKLGMDKSRFHWRCLSRTLRKVEALGIWRRIRVPLPSNRTYNKKGEQNVTTRCHARCVKFIRDITIEDWHKLANSPRFPPDEDEEPSDGDDDKGDKDNEDIDVDAINEQLARVDADEIEEAPRELPQWSMNIPVPNIIFNLVHAAGKDGISSMEIIHQVIGSFYYRPMDQILHRMTDFPSKSQPPQYIRLAVIRETSITHRQTHYHYFSYAWHQELVREGVAVEPWAAKGKKKGIKTGSQGEAMDQTPRAQELDEFGFPAVSSARLLKKDGAATLAESQLTGKKKENTAAYKDEPGWQKGTPRTGRPRKYEKGKEPYLAGKRRREAALAAKALAAGVSSEQGTNKRTLEDMQDKVIGQAPKRGRPPKKQKIDDTPTVPKRRGHAVSKRSVATETVDMIDAPEAHQVQPIMQTPNFPGVSAPAVPKRRGRPPKKKAKVATASQSTPQGSWNVNPSPAVGKSAPASGRRGRKLNNALEGENTSLETLKKRKTISPPTTAPATKKRSAPDVEMPLTLTDGLALIDILGQQSALELQKFPSQSKADIQGPESSFIATDQPNTIAMAIEGSSKQTPTGNSELLLVEQNPTFDVDGIAVEAEKLDDDNSSYGSIGGMLALGRQQVVLDLISEHQGVFPGGNELRHAFDTKYKKKNQRAGTADRRLVRGVVQSLQYKGKVNQYTFSFMTTRGTTVTKKLLVDSKLPVESPLVSGAIREIKAADGNLWYPPGTELPADVQEKILNPITTWVQAQPSIIEGIEFDRMYPTSVEQIKKQREERAAERAIKNAQKAEEKRMRQELRALKRSSNGEMSHWAGKFTDEQREEARVRKAELKSKIIQLRNKFHAADDEVEEETSPKTIWWEDFIQRPDGNTFLKDVKDVRQWEILMGQEDESLMPTEGDGLVMINHFGPEVEVGKDFRQSPALLDDPIRPRDTSNSKSLLNPNIADRGNGKPIKRRRRRVLKNPPVVSRREQAMAAIHQTTTLEKADDQQEVHAKKDQTHRNKYTIPKEDEDTLLIAVIIVRTIFGNVDRKINWSLVQKSAPQHQSIVLQRRWPRVRDIHKTHLKKLQSEFEEMYLEAYAKGQLPQINLQDPMNFDLPYHIKWFRDNLELPEAHAVPELSSKREVFENLYSLRPDKRSAWRADYHNPTFTMGNRANHFVCYAYEFPLETEKDSSEGSSVVEYVKSIIKANIITDASNYNPAQAFAIIHAQPEDAVDEAFFDLTSSKVIAHRKEHNRVTPGRNYELTDKFHSSLRMPMDEKLFAQALRFDRTLRTLLEKNETIELSPFMNDGSVVCIFDLIAHRRIRLEKRDFRAYSMGLVEGYETRSMSKRLVEFNVDIRAEPSYLSRPEVAILPPTPDGKTGNPIEPIRIWYDMNGNIIKGMWLRAVTSVLSLITGRPGIHTREISTMVHPGLTLVEAVEAIRWLNKRGAVEFRENSDESLGCWAKERFYQALDGL